MAKINHQRPILKIIDNYRRVKRLSDQSINANCSLLKLAESGSQKPMPILSSDSEKLILEMFKVFECYVTAETAFIQTLMPGKRKGQERIQKRREAEKARLVNACTKIVVTVIEQALREDMSLRNWLAWFQGYAESQNDSMLYDLLEAGFLPAIRKVETFLDEMYDNKT